MCRLVLLLQRSLPLGSQIQFRASHCIVVDVSTLLFEEADSRDLVLLFVLPPPPPQRNFGLLRVSYTSAARALVGGCNEA